MFRGFWASISSMLKIRTKFWQSALENCKEEQNSEKSFKEICKRLFVKTNGQTFIETKLDL